MTILESTGVTPVDVVREAPHETGSRIISLKPLHKQYATPSTRRSRPKKRIEAVPGIASTAELNQAPFSGTRRSSLRFASPQQHEGLLPCNGKLPIPCMTL